MGNIVNGIADPPDQYYGIGQQAVINGNLDRWERGTTFTNPVGNQYTAERFYLGSSESGIAMPTLIHSKQTLTSGDIPGSFNYYRINTDGAGSGYSTSQQHFIGQRIENGTRYLCGVGKKVTLSFYARSSIANKRIGTKFIQSYGTGGAPTTSEVINGQSFPLTSSWQKFSVTVSTNTLVSKTFGTNNDDFLLFGIGFMWSSDLAANFGDSTVQTFLGAGNVDIAQVQVNSGDTSLSYQPKNIGNVVNECMRYATCYTDANTSFPIGNGFALSTTVARIQVELPIAMRNAPTLSATATDWQLSDGVTATDLTAISIVSGQSSNKTVTLLCTVASGLTQFRPYQLIADGTANRLMIFEAEL